MKNFMLPRYIPLGGSDFEKILLEPILASLPVSSFSALSENTD